VFSAEGFIAKAEGHMDEAEVVAATKDELRWVEVRRLLTYAYGYLREVADMLEPARNAARKWQPILRDLFGRLGRLQRECDARMKESASAVPQAA
jgi:hypothetical protein